jgi:cytochrome c biogenesis protein CcdA
MKKIFSLISALFLFVGISFANSPFDVDQKQIDKEFKSLNKIESFVNQNQGTTLEDLKSQNSELIADVNLAQSSSVSALSGGDLPGNIPAFWWGCVLTLLGVILVYVLTDKDNAQTKKAFLGCIVTVAGYFLYYFVIAGLFAAKVA